MNINIDTLKAALINAGIITTDFPAEKWQKIIDGNLLKPFTDAMELAQKEVLTDLKTKSILTAKQVTDTIKLIK